MVGAAGWQRIDQGGNPPSVSEAWRYTQTAACSVSKPYIKDLNEYPGYYLILNLNTVSSEYNINPIVLGWYFICAKMRRYFSDILEKSSEMCNTFASVIVQPSR